MHTHTYVPVLLFVKTYIDRMYSSTPTPDHWQAKALEWSKTETEREKNEDRLKMEMSCENEKLKKELSDREEAFKICLSEKENEFEKELQSLNDQWEDRAEKWKVRQIKSNLNHVYFFSNSPTKERLRKNEEDLEDVEEEDLEMF